jgi:hypothetical protein
MSEEYGGMRLLLSSITHGKPGIIREPGTHGGLDIFWMAHEFGVIDSFPR